MRPLAICHPLDLHGGRLVRSEPRETVKIRAATGSGRCYPVRENSGTGRNSKGFILAASLLEKDAAK